jgi:branched-chain amino acid transport system substrate-binding protein
MNALRVIYSAAIVALLGSSGALAQDVIPIGLSSPQTGGAAYLGQHQRQGAELAVAELNEAGGVLGRQLELKVQDNQCNPTQGVASADQLIDVGKVVGIIGGLCSSVTLAIMPVIERAKVPLIVDVSTNPKISEAAGAGGNIWTFQINPSDAGLAAALGDYLASKGTYKSIAFVGEDTDYGRGGHEALKAALVKSGIAIGSADFFNQGAADFASVIARLRSKKPDAIALYAVGADELNFLRQYRAAGLNIPITGRIELSDLQASLIDAGALDGATSVFPYAPAIDTEGNKAFVAKFTGKFGEAPNYQSFEGYEAVKVLADAITRAGKADPAAIREALVTTSYPSMLDETISFDEHNQAHNKAVILRVEGTKVIVDSTSGT